MMAPQTNKNIAIQLSPQISAEVREIARLEANERNRDHRKDERIKNYPPPIDAPQRFAGFRDARGGFELDHVATPISKGRLGFAVSAMGSARSALP